MTRAGKTKVSSISISEEFERLLKQYGFSPTEVFRKGLAVSLFDLGVYRYQSDTNKKRSAFVKEFLKEYNENERLQKIFNSIADLNKIIKELTNN